MPNERTIEATYTNWRGETRVRRFTPLEPGLWWGTMPPYHTEPQWLLSAVDEEDGRQKDFALSGFLQVATTSGG